MSRYCSLPTHHRRAESICGCLIAHCQSEPRGRKVADCMCKDGGWDYSYLKLYVSISLVFSSAWTGTTTTFFDFPFFHRKHPTPSCGSVKQMNRPLFLGSDKLCNITIGWEGALSGSEATVLTVLDLYAWLGEFANVLLLIIWFCSQIINNEIYQCNATCLCQWHDRRQSRWIVFQ